MNSFLSIVLCRTLVKFPFQAIIWIRSHDSSLLCNFFFLLFLIWYMKSEILSFVFLTNTMVLKSTPGANVPVYQVSGTNVLRSLPDWVARKRRKSLKNDPEYANRIELIQDFQFDEASLKLKLSEDGQFCMATGTYKPQVHVYDFEQLALKFERHTDAENVDFVLISEDWTKSIHLQNDRSIDFHAQDGIHSKTRIPKFGRALAYNSSSCDLFVGASGNEVYRLNIDQGRFLAPFETENEGVNTLDISPAHGLLGFGTEAGTVEFWDSRSRQRIGKLESHEESKAITALSFDKSGLHLAVGTEEGMALVFDLRSATPLVTKDQGYGFPIKKVLHINNEKIATVDKRIAKIWNKHNGEPYTSIEPSVDINDMVHITDSGMFMFANEGIPMHTFYVPSIGPAPKWCSFLDSITEELEERPATSVYENYKFVTRKELSDLNLGHLIGSRVIKSYMHGYFIDMRLFEQARLITNPFAYREHREREVKKRIEKERESRIRNSTTTRVKVNKQLAKELVDQQGDSGEIIDERFKAIFDDPEFEIDENSHEFKLLHPTSRKENRDSKVVVSKNHETKQKSQRADKGSDSGDDNDQKELSEKDGKRENRRQRSRQNMMSDDYRLPAMKPILRTSRAANSFEDQIAVLTNKESQSASPASQVHHRARGEVEVSFVPRPKKSKKVTKSEGQGGRKSQHYEGRRRASKNAFRGM